MLLASAARTAYRRRCAASGRPQRVLPPHRGPALRHGPAAASTTSVNCDAPPGPAAHDVTRARTYLPPGPGLNSGPGPGQRGNPADELVAPLQTKSRAARA